MDRLEKHPHAAQDSSLGPSIRSTAKPSSVLSESHGAARSSLPSPRQGIRRWKQQHRWGFLLSVLLLVLVLLELFYVLAANAYLNSEEFKAKLNRRPDHFAIRWSHARTWIPGWVRVHEVAFVGQGVRDVYYGQMSQCDFRVSVLHLLLHRIQCSRFVAQDLDFRLSKSAASTHPRAPEYGGYPDIPMLAEVPLRQDGKQKGHGFSWDVEVSNIEFPSIRNLWIHALRFEGRSSMRARMGRAGDGVLWTEVRSYALDQGNLELGGRRAGTHITIRLAGGLRPVAVDDATDEEILDHVHADLAGDGRLDAVQLLQSRVGAQNEWIPEGSVRYRANVQIGNGRYLPGSMVALDASDFSFRIKDWKWRGRLEVRDRVETSENHHTAMLQARMVDLEWMESGEPPVALKGAAIVMESEARNLRLVDRFSDATLKVDLGSLELPNPKALNRYLPPGVSGSFQTGSLLCRAEFKRNGNRQFAGELSLEGDQLGARMKDEDYVLDMRLRANFETDALDTNRVRIGKTSLLLTNIQAATLSRRQSADWFTQVELDQGFVDTQPPWMLETPVRVWLRDTRPLAALLRAEKDSPGWMRWIPTVHEVRGECTLLVSTNVLEFRDLRVRGNYTEVRAQLTQEDGALRGLIYARWGLLSLGFDLRSEKREWMMLGAKRWYKRVIESRTTAPWRAPSAYE